MPSGVYVHYARGRKIGESRPGFGRGLIHYNSRKKLTGKMLRSALGEPNHYDKDGTCIGCSRYTGWGKITHYDLHGNPVGVTRHLLHTLYWHRLPISLWA